MTGCPQVATCTHAADALDERKQLRQRQPGAEAAAKAAKSAAEEEAAKG